ncbi:MAG: TIR domain-containing protein [Ruminococcaceae bacterium]|nr:TIR domain-containing protein [Oscillospiraceae bacterium]
MPIFKCKMCGGNLEITESSTVCKCEYCGSKQTVPNADDEKKINLFNRANRLRGACEFDKAASVYESIVAEFPEEAEAYWGLCLCKFGIEYVDDPKTAKKMPTCHRTSYISIFDDNDFGLACEYTDSVALHLYRSEAKEIDRLQKGILNIANNEEPFDIFICYKESDENGERTKDSVVAQDIYEALTSKGYRVFFSRITLEDKLGQEYEPYIFSALYSAKIMLAVGTKFEYYNAVWVKNEWGRFLNFMKTDKKKVLIPCYADIDAYDMPQEFKNIQGQDMGKVGFLQDLVRGIGKIIFKPEKAEPLSVSVISEHPQTEPLLKRAFMFLEDGDWNTADSYCEKVLDINPENAKAYLGKFMIENLIRNENDIALQPKKYDTSSINFKKALTYATPEERKRINAAIVQAKELYDKTFHHLKNPQEMFRLLSRRISCGGRYTSILLLNGCVVGTGSTGDINKRKLYNFAPINNAATLAHEFISRDNASINFFTYSTCSGDVMEICQNRWYDGKIQCYTPISYNWTNIEKVVCEYHHTIGLKRDGTVIAAGDNFDQSCEVSSWCDIIDIACGDYHTVGLKKDGSVVACGGKNFYDGLNEVEANSGQCDIKGWKDIAVICCSSRATYGVKRDGTICVAGDALLDRFGEGACVNWTDIVGISASNTHVVGIKSNGTVVACGKNDCGQCNVSGWTDVVVIACSNNHTVGIRHDGTILATGTNYNNQCDIVGYKFFFDENKEKIYYERLFSKRRLDRMCQHCGGTFKGLFNPKCTYCGQEKDY